MEYLNQMNRILKTFDYRLWVALILMGLLPATYLTIRINFLGDMPQDGGINIASQLAWINLIYEIFQEALILPLFYILGKSIENKLELENKIRGGVIVISGIYLLLAAFIYIFSESLVVFMAQDPQLISATVDYIRLETIAIFFSTMTRFFVITLLFMKKDRYLYIILAIQMILSIILDTFLISNLNFSIQMGVNGIAVSNIIVNISILMIALLLLEKEKIFVIRKNIKLSFSWIKGWAKVGIYSGFESFLRNTAFMIMIIRMVNVVAEQGNYWIANNFIWIWLLLPILALADVIKKEIGENPDSIQAKTFGYILVTTAIICVWIITIPLWKPFLIHVMNVTDYQIVFGIIILQLIPYMTFAFNSIIDSTFYGLGLTKYMLIQSICIDVVYYGIAFILYITGIYQPTLIGISIMFGLGMMLDLIPASILYFRMLRKRNIKIEFYKKEDITKKAEIN